nr:alpha/beta hydrolase [Rubrobacter marinus]
MREEIPDSRLLVLEGAGHVPMFERPARMNEALLAFLAGTRWGVGRSGPSPRRCCEGLAYPGPAGSPGAKFRSIQPTACSTSARASKRWAVPAPAGPLLPAPAASAERAMCSM